MIYQIKVETVWFEIFGLKISAILDETAEFESFGLVFKCLFDI